MLEARNIAFGYHGPKDLLFRDLSFSIAPGEILGLPGLSGMGKSTVAKLLGRYLSPLQGRVLLDGRPLAEKKGACPVQLLFQHPELAVNPRWKMRRVLEEGRAPVRDLMARLAIEDQWLDRYPHELSGGELQRICLARALMPTTRYLLCDEMTSMLDPLTQAFIWRAVLDIARERHLGLLVISHNAQLIGRICHRTLTPFQDLPN